MVFSNEKLDFNSCPIWVVLNHSIHALYHCYYQWFSTVLNYISGSQNYHSM